MKRAHGIRARWQEFAIEDDAAEDYFEEGIDPFAWPHGD